MATSPLFGWEEPDDTDLVKDGAAAIRTLGNAIDTSMGDLLGGTTGQVLSKASNTNMDFTWVTSDDANAIQNTIVDAKGDLIAASASDVPARLAVGNNGETLVADSSTSTGLRWQSAYNGNAIINGGMDIWQRGTTLTTSGGVAYTADRWMSWTTNAGGSVTTSRQTVSDTTNLPTIQYCTKFQRVASNTNLGILSFFYTAESADSYRFAGQTVTLSFYAKKGANYSAASSLLVSSVITGTGTDQRMYDFTGKVAQEQNNTLTTTWQRFTQTVTLASSTTEVALEFYFTPVGTAGADDSISITGVQLELGSRATTFKRSNGSGGTIQGELAACQRYYYRIQGQSSVAMGIGSGYANSTTAFRSTIRVPVTMRTTPSFTSSNVGGSNAFHTIVGSTQVYTDSLAANLLGVDGNGLSQTTSGITTGQGGEIFIDSGKTTSYLEWSAEL